MQYNEETKANDAVGRTYIKVFAKYYNFANRTINYQAITTISYIQDSVIEYMSSKLLQKFTRRNITIEMWHYNWSNENLNRFKYWIS